MNVLPADDPIDPHVWEQPQMRAALRDRDITEAYRLLGAAGVSQRRIAALTGQNQSEVSEIVNGRQVQAYDVLARIADGLGIPRSYLGLANPHNALNTEDVWMDRRIFLGLVGKLVMGASLTATELDLFANAGSMPAPSQVTAAEVRQIRHVTSLLRTHDAAYGGGACREAILGHTRWVESLRGASCTSAVEHELSTAVAEAQTLAGWTAHDLGLEMEARRHLTHAVKTAQDASDPAHAAIILCYLGRVPLDNGDPREALKLFQLGQMAAQDAGASRAAAFLIANQGIAYARIDDPRQALTALHRAEDEYARGQVGDQEILRMFDDALLTSTVGRVHAQLGLADARHRDHAVAHLDRALADGVGDRGRQRAYNEALLAATHLAGGELDTGVRIAHRALATARGVTSPRLVRAFAPLRDQAHRCSHHSDVRDLARQLHGLRAA